MPLIPALGRQRQENYGWAERGIQAGGDMSSDTV